MADETKKKKVKKKLSKSAKEFVPFASEPASVEVNGSEMPSSQDNQTSDTAPDKGSETWPVTAPDIASQEFQAPADSWEEDISAIEASETPQDNEKTDAGYDQPAETPGAKVEPTFPLPVLEESSATTLSSQSPQPASSSSKNAKSGKAEAKKAAPKKKGAKKGAKKVASKSGKKSQWTDLDPLPKFEVHDTREHLNIVFIGHVDSGKSTISGQILLLTGHVDERTIAKYEKEAQEKNRESWYLAYIMDTAEEERQKGKTVEVGRARFETSKKRYTLLDAPGHKNYVPNMIGGAAQADIGVLVISAREGEFEAGFDRGGQTREHAMLAKTLGIQRLVIMINKMDTQADPMTGEWAKTRYSQIESKLAPFLRKCGFRKEDISWIPVSGLKGLNLKNKEGVICKWYKGPCFMDLLDALPSIERDPLAPLRVPILARYKDMGNLCVLGKVESGQAVKNTDMVIMPTQKECKCVGLAIEEKSVDGAVPGENIILMLKGVEEEDIQSGFVLSYKDHVTKRARVLEVQLKLLELLPHKPLLTAGYSCILHVHTAQVECIVHKLLTLIDSKTGKSTKKPKFVKSEGACTAYIRMEESVACEVFDEFPQLGRFTLRDEGTTIAIGKIITVLQKKTSAEVQS